MINAQMIKMSAPIILSVLAVSFFGYAHSAEMTGNEMTGNEMTGNERLRLLQWEADARDARAYQMFATCADDDPQIAIGACTRQLQTQGNRSAFARGGLGDNSEDPSVTARIPFMDAIRYVLRANAYARQGETSRALRDYDNAVRSAERAGVLVRDDIYWMYERRAEAYFFEGDYDEALDSYGAAIEINPSSANVLNYRTLELAASYEEEYRDAPQALLYAQWLNERMPEHPDYVAALAIAYAANGEFGRAAMEQQRAINLVVDGDRRQMDAYRKRLELFTDGKTVRMAPRINFLDVQRIRLIDVELDVDVLDLPDSEASE